MRSDGTSGNEPDRRRWRMKGEKNGFPEKLCFLGRGETTKHMSFRKVENDISEVRFDEVPRSKVAGATSRCNFWAPQTDREAAQYQKNNDYTKQKLRPKPKPCTQLMLKLIRFVLRPDSLPCVSESKQ